MQWRRKIDWSSNYWPIALLPSVIFSSPQSTIRDPPGIGRLLVPPSIRVTRCWIRYFLQLTKLLQCRAQRCMLNRRICNYFPDITTAKRFKVAQLGNVRKCVCSSGARHDIRIADCCNPCSALSSPSSIRGLSATWNWPRNTDRVMLKLAQ